MKGPFQPLKLLFSRKYPELLQLPDKAIKDRMAQLMRSEMGQVLVMELAKDADQLAEQAGQPQHAHNTHLTAHFAGGAFALRRLAERLQALDS